MFVQCSIFIYLLFCFYVAKHLKCWAFCTSHMTQVFNIQIHPKCTCFTYFTSHHIFYLFEAIVSVWWNDSDGIISSIELVTLERHVKMHVQSLFLCFYLFHKLKHVIYRIYEFPCYYYYNFAFILLKLFRLLGSLVLSVCVSVSFSPPMPAQNFRQHGQSFVNTPLRWIILLD